MPTAHICWEWEEAFDKFGFGDGDGPNFTSDVAAAIQSKFGYECHLDSWGIHNFLIMCITDPKTKACVYKRKPWTPDLGQFVEKEIVEGVAYVKADDCNGWNPGYDDPRSYLPDEVIAYLDETFKDED